MTAARVAAWLDALERRHLASFTPSEVARALRALSSTYVERRDRLERVGALDTAGKRAAFALFYAPQHFFIAQAIVAALPSPVRPRREVVDVGCGTGSAGAAWALHAGSATIHGLDRHPWAVAEATWTYRELGLAGRASQRDAGRAPLRATAQTAVMVAYAANEIGEAGRAALLEQLVAAHGRGAAVLVIEPIARRAMPWWPQWQSRVAAAGGRADEWRFPSTLPPRQQSLARAAGLDPRELTARSLYLSGV
ncbi:MAG: class I SAM-dependent methyltransferase [Vicinamibacterales bacterium]